jgi:uncharacterized protein
MALHACEAVVFDMRDGVFEFPALSRKERVRPVASQVVQADKRYRISLLLDAYGELLTVKQRTFLKHYYEEDLSFGEIAKEYGVSRQAIFDSVKHGEETLNEFEKVLRLVETGWLRVTDSGLTPDRLADALAAIRDRLPGAENGAREQIARDLDVLVKVLRSETNEEKTPSESNESLQAEAVQ